jgi:hypothetical protein
MTDIENKEIPTRNEELEEILREAMEKQSPAELERTDGVVLEGRVVGFSKVFGEGYHQEIVVFGPGPGDKEIFSHGNFNKINRNIMKMYVGLMIDQKRRNIPSWVTKSLKILPDRVDIARPSMEIKTGYAVVERRGTINGVNPRNFSPPDWGFGELGVIYRIGRWTDEDPYEHGPFLVFKDKKDAEKYYENHSGKYDLLNILEVQYSPAVDEKGEPFKYTWERIFPNGMRILSVIDKPEGTDLAFSLRPLRAVK